MLGSWNLRRNIINWCMERTKWGRRKLKKKSRKTEKLKKNLFGVAYKTETELKSVLTIPFDSLLHHI